MPRRSKLTPKTIADYCAARQIGATQSVAALYAGVDTSSITHWKRRGEELRAQVALGETVAPADKIYLRFMDAADEADASAAIEWLEVVNKAAKTDPGWAWRLLKQRYPEEYMERNNVDVTSDGAPLTVTLRWLEDDDGHA